MLLPANSFTVKQSSTFPTASSIIKTISTTSVPLSSINYLEDRGQAKNSSPLIKEFLADLQEPFLNADIYGEDRWAKGNQVRKTIVKKIAYGVETTDFLAKLLKAFYAETLLENIHKYNHSLFVKPIINTYSIQAFQECTADIIRLVLLKENYVDQRLSEILKPDEKEVFLALTSSNTQTTFKELIEAAKSLCLKQF